MVAAQVVGLPTVDDDTLRACHRHGVCGERVGSAVTVATAIVVGLEPGSTVDIAMGVLARGMAEPVAVGVAIDDDVANVAVAICSPFGVGVGVGTRSVDAATVPTKPIDQATEMAATITCAARPKDDEAGEAMAVAPSG